METDEALDILRGVDSYLTAKLAGARRQERTEARRAAGGKSVRIEGTIAADRAFYVREGLRRVIESLNTKGGPA